MLSLCVEEHVNGPVAISGLGLMYPIFSQAVGEMLKKIGIKKLPYPIAHAAFSKRLSTTQIHYSIQYSNSRCIRFPRGERDCMSLSREPVAEQILFSNFFRSFFSDFPDWKNKGFAGFARLWIQEQQGCNRQNHAISLCQMDIRQVPLFSTQSSQLQCWS